ncbi:hypothetical protein [Actinomadura sp. 3N508]|uniref:hypothetical protein n=1 Tax=Actinomadura sp. 3N508 TaxID=3375153 RepID=UPI003799BE46
MAHETSVHHYDAALTAGLAFAVAPDLAANAITELLELLSGAAAAETPYKPEPAELSGIGWPITREPGGPTWERRAAKEGVTITGPTGDLVLVPARRVAPTAVTVTGDRSLLDHWPARTIV